MVTSSCGKRTPRVAARPAIGATVVPALLFFRTARPFGEPLLVRAWPVACAIDLALA